MFSGNNSSAQLLDSNQNRKNSYKFDLSLDLYNLFVRGNAGVMLRYGQKDVGAFRVRLSGSTGKTINSGQSVPSAPVVPFLTSKSTQYDASVGYEFHKNRKNFQLFFGPELSIYRLVGKNEYATGYSGPSIGRPDVRILQTGGFIGVKYFILKRLSISSETHLSYKWSTTKVYEIDITEKMIGQGESRYLSFDQLRFLNVSFHF